jgi:hypothetical protein
LPLGVVEQHNSAVAIDIAYIFITSLARPHLYPRRDSAW